MADTTAPPTPTPDATATAPTAQPTTPDYSTQPAQLSAPAPAAPAPTQPAQPSGPPVASAPASAATGAMPGVHGILGSVVVGALKGVAQHLAKGVGHELNTFARQSPYGQELQKNALERQQAQQNMQVKQKQEERAEQTAQQQQTEKMDAHTEAVLRTNGMTLDNLHKVHENEHIEAMYPGEEAIQKNTLMTQLRDQNAADRDLLSTLQSMGVHVDTSHGAGHDGLTSDHAKDVATGKSTMLSNGKEGPEAGYGFVDNTELQNTVLPSDVKVISDWDLDSKTGKMTPVYTTLSAGHNTAFDALITHDAASKKFQTLQDQYGKQLANAKAAAEPAKDAAEIAKDRAEANAQNASADLNRAYAKQIGGGGGGTPTQDVADAVKALPPQVQQQLQAFDPGIQGLLIRGAGGWIDPTTFPERLTKGGIGITRATAEGVMTAINPNWTNSLYKTIQNTQNQFINGKEGQSIRSFNQFLVHSADLKDVSDSFARTGSPYINQPLNKVMSEGAGNPDVGRMATAVEAARNEWQSFIDSGYKPDAEQSKRASVLMSDSSTPAQIMGVLGVMGDQAVGRLDQLNESYRTATGIDYPNLVTPSGLQAGQALGLGGKLGKYKSGGAYNTGRTPQAPQGATHTAKGSDGKIHYTNAQGQDLGVVQ